MQTRTPMPCASDLMTRQPQTVTPELTLKELIEFMRKHEISCAPVVESRESNSLMGFVTEKDALENLSNEMFYGFPKPQYTVQTVMNSHPVAVTEDIDVFAIASLLVNHGYRHVPVVDSEHQLVGLVSRRDVLRAMQTYYEAATREQNAELHPPKLSSVYNLRYVLTKR